MRKSMQRTAAMGALRSWVWAVVVPVMGLAALLPTTCNAQAIGVASVSGLVTDQSGAPIAGAPVTMTQIETNASRTTVTGVEGLYALPSLPVGPYRLQISVSGFRDYEQSGINLEVGNNVQINVTMQLGSVSEHVEVTLSPTMVETTETAISQVIDSHRIVDLPLNGRQATDLILLAGAAVNPPVVDQTGPKSYFSSVTISVAGGQSGGVNYLLDGGDHNDATMSVNLPVPFPDVLQEFSLETSSVPARFGMHPAGVVNAITKSGTNAWHGDLFEFLRNGDVNDRNFFAATHDSLKRNQFGGTFGGHVIRDKLFFFGGYQNTINRSDPPQTVSYTPTAAVMAGDFSTILSGGCVAGGKGKTILDPSTGLAFAGNQIPVSRFNPEAVATVNKYIPISNNPCGREVYGIRNNTNESQYIGRVDWLQSTKHTLYVRYFLANYQGPAVFDGTNLLQTTAVGNDERMQTVTIGDMYSLTPTILNSFHATFSRVRDDRGAAPNDISPCSLGLKIYCAVSNFIQISVNGYFSVGNGTGAPAYFNRNSFPITDDVDITRGRHHIAFGAYLARNQFNSVNGWEEQGWPVFNGSRSGDALADFMLGLPQNYSQSNPLQNYSRQWLVAPYVQDTIKVSRRVTINAGLRWEPTLPVVDREGATFSPADFAAGVKSKIFTNAPVGMLFYGDPGVPKAYYSRHLNNWSPRLGLAWDPRGDGRQTIRVSGSVLRDTMEQFYYERLTSNAPYASLVTIINPPSFTDPFAGYPGGNPFPGKNPPPSDVTFAAAGTYYIMPRYITPTYAAQWNVSYQRQISANWLGTVTYLGNKTTHIWAVQELDPAIYIPGTCSAGQYGLTKAGPCSSTGNTNQRRRFYLQNPAQGSMISSMAYSFQGGNSEYGALLATIQHRFSHNFTVLSNYTYSHCLSNANFNAELGLITMSNSNNMAADRGNCNFDTRHLSNTSLVATSPAIGSGWTKRVLSNWQLSPLLTVRSGMATGVTTGVDNSLTGIGRDRPNVVAGVSPYLNKGAAGFLNPAAFTPNVLGTFGNLGAYALYSPTRLQFDLALSRMFTLREPMRLEVRSEAFNAINHTNLTGVSTALNSSTFGVPQSAGDPRILQFAMKLHF